MCHRSCNIESNVLLSGIVVWDTRGLLFGHLKGVCWLRCGPSTATWWSRPTKLLRRFCDVSPFLGSVGCILCNQRSFWCSCCWRRKIDKWWWTVLNISKNKKCFLWTFDPNSLNFKLQCGEVPRQKSSIFRNIRTTFRIVSSGGNWKQILQVNYFLWKFTP